MSAARRLVSTLHRSLFKLEAPCLPDVCDLSRPTVDRATINVEKRTSERKYDENWHIRGECRQKDIELFIGFLGCAIASRSRQNGSMYIYLAEGQLDTPSHQIQTDSTWVTASNPRPLRLTDHHNRYLPIFIAVPYSSLQQTSIEISTLSGHLSLSTHMAPWLIISVHWSKSVDYNQISLIRFYILSCVILIKGDNMNSQQYIIRDRISNDILSCTLYIVNISAVFFIQTARDHQQDQKICSSSRYLACCHYLSHFQSFTYRPLTYLYLVLSFVGTYHLHSDHAAL